MLARKTWCGDPNAGIATRFPLRSRRARICSVPNSSKQPTCRPPKKTTGSPASTRRMYGAENWLLMSIPPEANRGFGNEPDGSSLTYCTSDFAPEKLLRHELRRDTDAAPVIQPDSRCLERCLLAKHVRNVEQAGSSGGRQRREEPPPILHDWHLTAPSVQIPRTTKPSARA